MGAVKQAAFRSEGAWETWQKKYANYGILGGSGQYGMNQSAPLLYAQVPLAGDRAVLTNGKVQPSRGASVPLPLPSGGRADGVD